jgi:sestrin
MLFVDAFLQNNRLDHVTQVMGYHPTYLDVFLRTQNFILRGDGPLPYDYRHFIAIMVRAFVVVCSGKVWQREKKCDTDSGVH